MRKWIEAFRFWLDHGDGKTPLYATVSTSTWSQKAEILLRANKKIGAIKECRAATGWSLKKAKDAVESLQRELGL